MELNLETLGFTREELQERVIEKLCESLMTEISYDEDGDQYNRNSNLKKQLDARVVKLIDKQINHLAEKHVLPNVAEYVENLTLQETSRWGEKTGKKYTFLEYLISRAEAYLQEDVNYEGKSKTEANGYSWSKSQTRLTHLVHQHLHYSISTAMGNAIKTVNAAIVPALTETTKIKLEEIAAGLQVSVTQKK